MNIIYQLYIKTNFVKPNNCVEMCRKRSNIPHFNNYSTKTSKQIVKKKPLASPNSCSLQASKPDNR